VGKQHFVSAQHGRRLCLRIYSTGSNSSNNFIAAVKSADFTKQKIVFVDIAFVDLGDADVVNTLYGNLFAEGLRPARTIYEVAALSLNSEIKVMSTVAKD
jgi:2-iminobutanoate/2-iminopropanoate deaminase